MFGDLVKGLFDSESAISETIKNTLTNLSKELQCKHTDLFVMIKPTNEQMDFKFWVYKTVQGRPELVREISLKEILDS